MRVKQLPWRSSVWAILCKEILCELRTRYALSALAMFALVTLSSLSMALAGVSLSPTIAGALVWVIVFFSAMAGLARTFVQEQETGTMIVLRFYGRGQAVMAGKLLFNILLLQLVVAFLLPLSTVFLNLEIELWGEMIAVLFLGTVGIAAVTTLTGLMVAATGSKGSLCTVITFPVLLPQFLTAVATTGQILAGTVPEWREFAFLGGYDVAVVTAASLLFDYLWYD